jgi:predicted RNA-binding Zn-ribbon protein involved in translation (DUF1610 family)
MESTKNTAALSSVIFDSVNPSFLDADSCRRFLLTLFHPAGPACPACGETMAEYTLQNYWQGKRVQCSVCGKFFSGLTGTALSGWHMDYREIVLLAIFMGCGWTNRRIADRMGYHTETIRILRRKIRAIAVQAEMVSI